MSKMHDAACAAAHLDEALTTLADLVRDGFRTGQGADGVGSLIRIMGLEAKRISRELWELSEQEDAQPRVPRVVAV